MPEKPAQGAGSEGAEGTGGDNSGEQPKPKEGEGSGAGGEWSEERARATIERQRESERAAKAAQKTAEDELAELRKNLPEKERLEREKAAAEAKAATAMDTAQKIALRGEATRVATTLKFKDPALAMKFIDKGKIEWSEDGEPNGIRTQLEAAAKEYPFLIGTTSTGDAGEGGEGNGTGGKTMSEMVREAAGRGQ